MLCVFHVGCRLSFFFFFSSRRRHTRSLRDWSSDVCSSDLAAWLCCFAEPFLTSRWQAVKPARADAAPPVGQVTRQMIRAGSPWPVRAGRVLLLPQESLSVAASCRLVGEGEVVAGAQGVGLGRAV